MSATTPPPGPPEPDPMSDPELEGRTLERIRTLIHDPARRLTDLHLAGHVLATRVRPDKRYGDGWAVRTAATLDCDKSFFHKLVSFAERFDADRVQRLQEAGVTWSHTEQVLKLDDPEVAFGLLLDAAAREWSVRDLQFELRRQEPLAPPRPGRQPEPPVSHGLEVDLLVLEKLADAILRLTGAVWAVPVSELVARSSTGLEDGCRERAGHTAGRLRDLAAAATAIAVKLDTVENGGPGGS